MTLRRELKLHFYPDQILNTVAERVDTYDNELQWLADQMLMFMREYKGIGLAAPQIGVLYRIVVIDIEGINECLVNPEILSTCRENITENEGCLSIPNRWYDVERPLKIELRASSLHGANLHFEADGLAARVLQHEIDHLNGILICDHGVEISRGFLKY